MHRALACRDHARADPPRLAARTTRNFAQQIIGCHATDFDLQIVSKDGS
jgi:hypothetical protein